MCPSNGCAALLCQVNRREQQHLMLTWLYIYIYAMNVKHLQRMRFVPKSHSELDHPTRRIETRQTPRTTYFWCIMLSFIRIRTYTHILVFVCMICISLCYDLALNSVKFEHTFSKGVYSQRVAARMPIAYAVSSQFDRRHPQITRRSMISAMHSFIVGGWCLFFVDPTS